MTPYHAKYFAYELTRRSASDSIQKLATALVDAQVDLNPHQVEAALFAFRSPLSKGAILADEVGLGKTIEAGLVISQKWAERHRKILIIVPANLRKQWSQELLDKFFLPTVIIENASFNNAIRNGNLNPFDQKDIVICSYQFARKQEPYIKTIPWDLVVIDEAHRLRNVYKPTNKIANAIKNAVADTRKILLTATPLQNSILELYGLVSVIDDLHFGDLKSFKMQYSRLGSEESDELYLELKQRLRPICHRTLRRQVLEYIKFTNRKAIVEEFYPSAEEQKLYELVSEYLQRADLYALPKSQRSLMTLILRRLLASSTFAISGTLEALASKLDQATKQNGLPVPIGEQEFTDFEAIKEFEDEWQSDEEEESVAAPPKFTPEEIAGMKREMATLQEFHTLAKSIKINTKGDKLITALKRGFEEAVGLGAQRKAIVFTESIRTQNYLKQILEQNGYAGQIVLFNGSNTDPESRDIYRQWIERNKNSDRITGSETADKRAAIVEYFRDTATIMIATEAAAEGINLQFCSLVVNYDLPWNPQRIEQRIGRCHRYGQKYDVVVVNFLNKANAADQRVYDLLDQKFKLFSGVFGASDEVLGSIESGVDFEKRIAKIYQDCRTPDEIQLSFDFLQKELEEQISGEMSKTKQKLLENFDEEVHEKLRINLEESSEYLSKYEQWLWDITSYFLRDHANFSTTDHSFTLHTNPFPNEVIHNGPYRIGKNIDDANVYRIHHPLAQRVIDQCKSAVLPLTELCFHYTGSEKKISILESLIGQSGWLRAFHISIESFEVEDRVFLVAYTDKGELLDIERCRRLFSLNADETKPMDSITSALSDEFEKAIYRLQTDFVDEVMRRNAGFLDAEMEKLDQWAEDIKRSLEIELRNLDVEIKIVKAEARKVLKLEEKVALQRDIKEKEKKRNTLRLSLYQQQDEVDKRKEQLIEDIEKRLHKGVERNELFTIRWSLK
ncbi:MAG TPA: SNF2-related protein [bacterium]|nr:SNF2-related protein [bacterium]